LPICVVNATLKINSPVCPILAALLLKREPITNLANSVRIQECFGSATEYLAETSSQTSHRSNQPVVSKKTKTMIPPTYLAAQLQAAQRRAREGIQAVPSMESDAVNQQQDSLFTESVLDLSRYLSSSDLPTTPCEFFDDLFHERVANNDALRKSLPGVIKVKEEPDSAATSRCSTPESLLPEHDFDNAEFPTPKFQGNNQQDKGESLMCQLQSINHSSQTSENESDEEINVESLDLNAQKLKAALTELEQGEGDLDVSEDESPSHRNSLKSPRSKMRKMIKKGSDEYLVKRERNNVAVRKSRTKAKLKHIETQMRVGELMEENEQLRNRVSSLQKELNALKSFITYNCPSSTKSFSSYPPIFSSTKIM
jgi:hypothetical protein